MASFLRPATVLLSTSGALLLAATVVIACRGDDPDFSLRFDGGDLGDGGDLDADAGPPCDLSKRFDPPAPVPGLSGPAVNVGSARFTADELTAFFEHGGYDGGVEAGVYVGDIYMARRSSTAAAFGPMQRVTSLTTTASQRYPSVTGDGTVIFVSRDAPRNEVDIWSASGAATNVGLFTAATQVAGAAASDVNFGDTSDSPYVLPDGHALYFTSRRSSGGGIFRAARTDGVLSGTRLVKGLPNDPQVFVYAPVVTPDELTIYWAQAVAGTGSSDFGVYVATRTDVSVPFANVRALDEINTPTAPEIPSFISADGCRLYYTSYQPQPGGSGNVYVATKPK